MILILGMVLALIFSAAVSVLYVFIRPVVARWALAVIVPYVLADGLRWIYLLRNGGCDSECDAWSLIPLGALYLPGYVASAIIVFRTRAHNSLRRQVQPSAIGGLKSVSRVSGREMLGLLLAPLASVPVQLIASPISDAIGGLVGVYLLFAIFGVPTYLLFRILGLLRPWHFVVAGTALGALLPLFLIWLINPNLWMLGQRWAFQEDMLTTVVFIVSAVVISGVFWLISFAPAQHRI